MDTLSIVTLPAILFALTVAFGFWLSHVGKPYHGILFNVHKLMALGGVVLAGIQLSKTLDAPAWQLMAWLVVSALCVMALFISGALMSAGKLDYAWMLAIHRVAPLGLAACLGLVFVLLKSSP